MAFQRLNIRAKKSFPGLYSLHNTDNPQSPKSTVTQHESPSYAALPIDNVKDCDLEEFGAGLERCKDSPSKDSPSKRNRLFGSLRSLRSLRNLHSTARKTKQVEMPRTESPVQRQDLCMTPTSISPSLALDFEQSPPDQPIFELNMHHRSVSGFSLEVHHSSPVTVPGSARQTNPYNISPSSTDLPAGTVPTTPGPLQRAFDRDPANHVCWQNTSPTPLERHVPSAPALTPLPGTNLSLEDINTALVTLPPSVIPLQPDHHDPGYFDIPIDEQPSMDNADVLNGLACLQLSAGYGDTDSSKTDASSDGGTYTQSAGYRSDEGMRLKYEETKLQDTRSTQHFSQRRNRALRRKQQARDPYDSVHAIGVPQHHQVLPLRLKKHDGDGQDRVRQDSVINEDWDTSSGEPSTSTTSEHIPERRNPCQSHRVDVPVNSISSVSPEGYKRTGDENRSPANFAYIVWDGPDEACRRAPAENAWGRHIGLYDGTGYGDDASLPATPYEPDEGTKDIYKQFNPRSFEIPPAPSVDGDGSEKKIFAPH